MPLILNGRFTRSLYILTFTAIIFVILLVWKSSTRAFYQLLIHNARNHSAGNFRIAVLIPFVGNNPESIPPYLNVFITAAAGTSDLLDFYIFHNSVLNYVFTNNEELPANVKLVDMGSITDMMKHFLKVVDQRKDEEFTLESREYLLRILCEYLMRHPYVLVEFKPALGHIFQSYLSGYTHWAYSDIDIVFGDISRWITFDELTNFDIVTYGFGETDRVYLRGQFTVHRNDPYIINQLWRECDYLSKMDERFAEILAGVSKLNFESAEACYSVNVVKRDDIRVKFAVKAFTDTLHDDTSNTHGIYFSMGKYRDRSVLLKATAGHGKAIVEINPQKWLENVSSIDEPYQIEIGEKTPVNWRKDPSINCMFWVRDIYRSELCIEYTDSSHTIFLENGKLFKQRFSNQNLPTSILSAPFFHFQEWKRRFRYNQIAAFNRKSAIDWVLTKEGAIPLPSNEIHLPISVQSPLGILPLKWRGIQSQMPPHSYCLKPAYRKHSTKQRILGCEFLMWWRKSESISILSNAPAWRHVDTSIDVTLALTLQITPKQANEKLDVILDVALANVESWSLQPSVLIVQISGATETITQQASNRLKGFPSDSCFIALISIEDTDLLSRKALMNMAVDISPSRWIVSGIELERGLIISREASMLCRRKASIHRLNQGQIFILPQYAATAVHEIRSLSLMELLNLKTEIPSRLFEQADFEKTSCEIEKAASNSIFDAAHDMWWRFTSLIVNGISLEERYELLNRLARILDQLELSFIDMMVAKNDLKILDDSPILMIDNIGPNNVLTSTFIREVEEFGGKFCYNSLRLAQLATLGYNFHLLFGGFAVSTDMSRDSVLVEDGDNILGSSRCDGCVYFHDEDTVILESILDDERRRVAKAATLWAEKLNLN
jgi:hypothetical protein